MDEVRYCNRCGSSNIKSSISIDQQGRKRYRHVCRECKRKYNKSARNNVSLPKLDFSDIGWDDNKIQAWNKQARESRERISLRFGK